MLARLLPAGASAARVTYGSPAPGSSGWYGPLPYPPCTWIVSCRVVLPCAAAGAASSAAPASTTTLILMGRAYPAPTTAEHCHIGLL